MAKYLQVGVEMSGSTQEDEVPLPANWDEMSAEDQEVWAIEVLEVHVSNNVDSWHNVIEKP